MMRRWTWLGLAALASCLGFVGCGGSSAPDPSRNKELSETQALNEVGELYRLFTISKKKPPEKLADLALAEQMGPMGLNALRTGDVIVRLGAQLPDTKEEPEQSSSDEVLAWYKYVPAEGGPVLMLNRKLTTMSAEDFKSAKKAGTSDSTAEPAGGAKKK